MVRSMKVLQQSSPVTHEEIDSVINDLWELHDEAEAAGNQKLADSYSAEAFKLLAKLPENKVYLVSSNNEPNFQ